MDNQTELNLNELETAVGGEDSNNKPKAGGSPNPLPPLAGYKNYQILATDTMIRIADRFHTTVDKLMEVNKKWIKDKRWIRTGYYMYVPNK